MANAIKNELIKLLSKKKYIALLIIAFLICFGRSGIDFLLSKLAQMQIKNSNMIMELFPFFAEIYIPLIIFMAVCDLFSSEMSDLTIKASLVRPITRFKLMSAKIFSCFFVGVLFFVFIYVICAVLQRMFGKISTVYYFKSAAAYLIDLVPMYVLVLFAVLVNMMCKSPTFSMFMTIVSYAVLKYCNYFSPILNNLIFTSYMQWHKLLIGSMIPFGALMPKIAVLLSSATVLYTVDFILFDKKEY